MTSNNKQQTDAFSRHSQQQLQPDNNNTNDDTNNNNSSNTEGGGDFGQMSVTGRLLVFICVPCLTGIIGLVSSYLESKRPLKDDGDKPHIIDFDRDFVTPFLLGLAFVIVIGFQTGGFKVGGAGGGGGGKKFALSWPKAKRVRKVRRERVIVDDDGGDLDTKKER